MANRWWAGALILLAVLVLLAAGWVAVALPTGHHRVVECLRPNGDCVGPEDFRYPQRIALLAGGGLIAGVLFWTATRRSSSDRSHST